MKPVNIAIVVHNPIKCDSRVRKQAKSLSVNGLDIALFGYGGKSAEDQRLDGAPMLLIDKIPISRPVELLRWLILTPESYAKQASNLFPNLLGFFLNLIFTIVILSMPVLLLAPDFFNPSISFTLWFWVFVLLFSIALAYEQDKYGSVLLFWTQAAAGFIAYSIVVINFFQIPIGSELIIILILIFGIVVVLVWQFKKTVFNLLHSIKVNYGMRIGYELVAYKLAKSIQQRSPKIIHAHDIIALIAAIKVKKLYPETKVVWDAHELYTELAYKTPKTSRYINRIIMESAPHISHFITINESIASIYEERYPDLPKALVLMNATNRNEEEGIKSIRLRVAAAVDEEQCILLFQGGFSAGRGIAIMLEAASDLPHDWTMVFMGSGQLEHEINKTIESLNPGRPIGKPVIAKIAPAPYEELAYWTSGADLGIIPYENRSLNHLYCTPNKLWEYPNAGVPILASSMIEMSRFISNNDIGICMPTDFTAQDIISALVKFDRKKQKYYKQQCILFNKTENWAKYEKSLLKIYKGMNT